MELEQQVPVKHIEENIKTACATDDDVDPKVTIEKALKWRHPLKREWTFWYLNDNKNLDWLKRLKEICTVKTLEDFWMLFKNIRTPSRLANTCDYNFFRDQINPRWEADENKLGGRWRIQVNPSPHSNDILDIIWQEVLVAMIGEQFGEDMDQICGVVLNARNKGCKVCIWTKYADKMDANERIGRILKQKLLSVKLPDRIKEPLFDVMFYEKHDDTQTKRTGQAQPMKTIHANVD
ncbi:hypothetical protein L596_027363 [Steinernema carpocapsae]|uniref:eIF-4F 25 kDa subunit n=1 Tax=Steinernema carpocapsae TaxID=34508 RepID=A0A4U5M437_STECR|nr:hypothetical protein L596_027363 [Steinernema carpocapsae]